MKIKLVIHANAKSGVLCTKHAKWNEFKSFNNNKNNKKQKQQQQQKEAKIVFNTNNAHDSWLALQLLGACNAIFFLSCVYIDIYFPFHPIILAIFPPLLIHTQRERVQLHSGWHLNTVWRSSSDKWTICEYHRTNERTFERTDEWTNDWTENNVPMRLFQLRISVFFTVWKPTKSVSV